MCSAHKPCPLECNNDSLCMLGETLVEINDVVANEPDEIREVRSSSLVANKFQHVLILNWRERKHLNHSLARAPTHSSTNSFTHSSTHSTHSLTHSLTHTLIYSLTHQLTHPLTHSFTHTHTQTHTHSPHSLTDTHSERVGPTHSLSGHSTHSLTHPHTHTLLQY